MDLETQKIFVRSALHFAMFGCLNLNNEQLINMYEECSLMAGKLQEIVSFVLAHQSLAELSCKLSRFDKALRSNDILLSIFHQNGQRKWEAVTLGELGSCYHMVRKYDKALKNHEMSLNIAREIGDKKAEAAARCNIGSCYYSLGQYNEAVEHYKTSLNIAREIGDKATEAKATFNLGNCYHSLAQYDEAVKHHKMSLNIMREMGDKTREGRVYGNLGTCYHSLGQYDEAVKHYKISLNITREIGDKAVEGIVYDNLGSCYHSLGEYDEAVKHHKMGLKVAKEIENKFGEGRVNCNLGGCYHSLGQYDKAVKPYKMSLNIAKEIGDKVGEGRVYANFGNYYHSLGQYDEAVKHHKMSLNIRKELGDKAGEGSAYGNLGNCYHSLGQYDKAVKHHTMSLNITKEIGDKAGEGSAYGNLGKCYHSLGQYEKAVKNHEMSLNIAREIGNKATKGSAYCNLGNCYYSLGQYDKAVKQYEMCLNIAKQIGNKPTEGNVYVNLGNCYNSLGKYNEAVTHHKMSLKIMTEIGDKAGEGRAYGNLGNCYDSLGQYNEAVTHHKMSLKIMTEIGNKAEEGRIYGSLGNCYVSLGKYDKALKNHEMSLNIAREIGDKATEAITYCNLGINYCYLVQYNEAVWNLKEGLKRFEELFQNTPQTDELKISVREIFSESYRQLVIVLIEQDKTDEALVFCERGRAQALVNLMHFKFFLHDYKSEENWLDFAAVCRLVTSLQSTVLYFALMNDCICIWIIQPNGSIHFTKSSLSAQRADQCPSDVSSCFSEQVNVLISNFRSSCIECEDRSLLLLRLTTEIEQNDEKLCPELCSSSVVPKAKGGENLFAKECTTESSDTDTLLRNPFSDEEDVETLKKLHQILLAPAQDHIEGKEIVIVPEGPLHLVPFGALMDGDDHYVAESLRVRLFPSLTTAKMILDNDFEPNKQMKPLIVGDPDTGCLPRLPCANKEARMVAKLFNISPLIGGEATKETVLSSIENASLIHIAAHGNMERGEIVLAQKPTDTSSSKELNKENMLMMADLERKRINAKLVVLSCCHSARGKITSEGVVGIARAFLGTGVRSVLVALWAINDGATLYFMERFYEHLTQGKSAGESLSEAMAAMRAPGKYNDPRHWAPFVLIGDDVSVC